ncbi:MAG: thioredoxin family protein [Thermodesulfovibrionales bacterium]|nr:thioredoxin family protein [Thermodesulfovibrionales bacterium]
MLIALAVVSCSQNPKTVEDQIEYSKKKGKTILIQIGADSCIPCVEMKDILQRVKEDYKDKIIIIDVNSPKEKELVQKLSISKIPTQIFIDKKANEYGRHEGYFSYEEISHTLKEMGVNP